MQNRYRLDGMVLDCSGFGIFTWSFHGVSGVLFRRMDSVGWV